MTEFGPEAALTSLASSALPFLSALVVGVATSAIQMLTPVAASLAMEQQRGLQ